MFYFYLLVLVWNCHESFNTICKCCAYDFNISLDLGNSITVISCVCVCVCVVFFIWSYWVSVSQPFWMWLYIFLKQEKAHILIVSSVKISIAMIQRLCSNSVTSVLHSGVTYFVSRPEHQLSWLKFLHVVIIPFGQIPGIRLKPHPAFFPIYYCPVIWCFMVWSTDIC
jgi:hypothetical protein